MFVFFFGGCVYRGLISFSLSVGAGDRVVCEDDDDDDEEELLAEA